MCNLYPGFTTCKVKDSNSESCLNSAIESGVRFLKSGFPAYNLLPLDPLAVSTLKIGAGAGAVHLEQNYQDISIKGFTDLTVNNSHVDFDKKTLTFSSMHPLLTQNAHYDINGKILTLPVHGKGPCTLTLENSFVNHLIEFEEKKIGNDIFYIPTSYALKLNPGHAGYAFENLFEGNKLLGDNINQIINQEWRTIFEDVGQGYQAAYAQIFLEYAKRIFGKVPVNQIFLQ